MAELIIALGAAERAALADLADATASTPQEVALAAVRAHLAAERARTGAVAGRLAEQHADLLRRLGA
ncbi:hypothetical protein [Streptomyces subrutilus]|uniref:hypothetical protein n=1 Tax=Streptomyces subrutilus TaxID=36818 RepID=UPI002E147189|nr:hypothetical protein OG479_13925 [Streptomyces subrutilus]